jgi:hypothetical protein
MLQRNAILDGPAPNRPSRGYAKPSAPLHASTLSKNNVPDEVISTGNNNTSSTHGSWTGASGNYKYPASQTHNLAPTMDHQSLNNNTLLPTPTRRVHENGYATTNYTYASKTKPQLHQLPSSLPHQPSHIYRSQPSLESNVAFDANPLSISGEKCSSVSGISSRSASGPYAFPNEPSK